MVRSLRRNGTDVSAPTNRVSGARSQHPEADEFGHVSVVEQVLRKGQHGARWQDKGEQQRLDGKLKRHLRAILGLGLRGTRSEHPEAEECGHACAVSSRAGPA